MSRNLHAGHLDDARHSEEEARRSRRLQAAAEEEGRDATIFHLREAFAQADAAKSYAAAALTAGIAVRRPGDPVGGEACDPDLLMGAVAVPPPSSGAKHEPPPAQSGGWRFLPEEVASSDPGGWQFTPTGCKRLLSVASWSAFKVLLAAVQGGSSDRLALGGHARRAIERAFPTVDCDEIAQQAVVTMLERRAAGEVVEAVHAVASARLHARHLALQAVAASNSARRWADQREFDSRGRTIGCNGLREDRSKAEQIVKFESKRIRSARSVDRAAAQSVLAGMWASVAKRGNADQLAAMRAGQAIPKVAVGWQSREPLDRRPSVVVRVKGGQNAAWYSAGVVSRFLLALRGGKPVEVAGRAAGLSKASAFRLVHRLRASARAAMDGRF